MSWPLALGLRPRGALAVSPSPFVVAFDSSPRRLTSIDAISFIGNALGTRIGRIQNDEFTTGDKELKKYYAEPVVDGDTVYAVAPDTTGFTRIARFTRI